MPARWASLVASAWAWAVAATKAIRASRVIGTDLGRHESNAVRRAHDLAVRQAPGPSFFVLLHQLMEVGHSDRVDLLGRQLGAAYLRSPAISASKRTLSARTFRRASRKSRVASDFRRSTEPTACRRWLGSWPENNRPHRAAWAALACLSRPLRCSSPVQRFESFLPCASCTYDKIDAPAGTWRKGWDSNPRWACTHGGFQDRCLKPLGHPSSTAVLRDELLQRKSR